MFHQATEEARLWLVLARAPRLKLLQLQHWLQDQTVGELFERVNHGSFKQLSALKITESQYQALRAPDWKAVDRDLQWLDQPGHVLLPVFSSHYPRLLQEISVPPPLLFVDGELSLLSRPQLAVVGSRHPSPQGLENAEAFAFELARRGYVISSGLAQGIDGAAHRGALAGGGVTLAVLGTGTDQVYPAIHRELCEQIRGQGVLISEFFPGTPPRSKHFPRRNRILSGLSLGTLVVEATPRSGSLITARYANEQGREVFAIPGSIHNPLARGCHQLIAQGAALVTSADDIEAQLSGWPLQRLSCEPESAEEKGGTDSGLSASVCAQMGWGEPTSVDLLAARTGLSVERLLPQLLELELAGQIQAVAGGYVRVRARQQSR